MPFLNRQTDFCSFLLFTLDYDKINSTVLYINLLYWVSKLMKIYIHIHNIYIYIRMSYTYIIIQRLRAVFIGNSKTSLSFGYFCSTNKNNDNRKIVCLLSFFLPFFK